MTDPSTDPAAAGAARTIGALRTGHDELAAVVSGLSAERLTGPSGASEWDVSQVLGHLGSGAEISLAALEGAIGGTGRGGEEFNRSVWARWDAMSPAERAEGFLRADEDLVRRYEGLDSATLASLRIDLGFLPEPVDVDTAAGLRLGEVAHHSWDVRVALDPTAGLAPEATEVLIDRSGMFIGFLGRPEAIAARPLTLAVATTAPQRSFGLDVRDTVALVDPPATPAGTLRAPAEWWLRLLSGRHAPEHTPAGVSLTGAPLTLDDLRRAFPGY